MIQGYPNYAISSFGRVRNLNTGRLLKYQKSERDDWYSFINFFQNNKRININAHVLVAIHFIGLRPGGMIIHRLSNLEYITQQKNCECGDDDII